MGPQSDARPITSSARSTTYRSIDSRQSAWS